MPTHDVLNQVPPLVDYDLAAADPLLLPLLQSGAPWAVKQAEEFGREVASAEGYELGFAANENPPQLRTHDRTGNRVDQVEFHPSWHDLLRRSVGAGLHSLPWEHGAEPGSHLARAALTFLASQVEAGHFCPISMTYAVVPALREQPELSKRWEPLIVRREYDSRFAPPAEKDGVLLGMGMTEKQGGSDVRAGTTTATPDGPGYRITGHKWFTSAPMNDAFLILAQAPGGLTCFLLPRHSPDGSINQIRIMRLKAKLGNRSNASAELEFENAWAERVGEEGRGVATIIEMVNGTRLDCVNGSAALMRQAVSQAIHHCRHRRAFGSALIDKPAMINVLADLEIETEAAVVLMARLAMCFDRSDDPHEQALRRVLTPLAKFHVTKRCTEVVHEALECLGGNGFVEESILPRLLRESPLNAIWEGSGNVIALDVLRAARTQPDSAEALRSELARGPVGGEDLVDRLVIANEGEARQLVEQIALRLQAGLLVDHASPEVAETFVASRISDPSGTRLYGTLPSTNKHNSIVERAIPV